MAINTGLYATDRINQRDEIAVILHELYMDRHKRRIDWIIDIIAIQNEALNPIWGPPEAFDWATVTMILRKLNLNKYRERWKWLLMKLNRTFRPRFPSEEFLADVEYHYTRIQNEFFAIKASMPPSIFRKNGMVIKKNRHNNMPFNYVFRKLCEAAGVRDFHFELPLLRSTEKLHALDDIMAKITFKLGIPFSRTAVMKWPKLRKRNRRLIPLGPPGEKTGS